MTIRTLFKWCDYNGDSVKQNQKKKKKRKSVLFSFILAALRISSHIRMSSHRRHHFHGSNDDITDNFLRSEIQSESQTRRRAPTPNVRVLKCFCGCSELTIDQIENYALMNVSGIVNNPTTNQLFKTFLRLGQQSVKSRAMERLECFECCNRILDLSPEQRTNLIDDLIDVCPSYAWEEKINRAFDADDKAKSVNHLNRILDELKIECLNEIESHNDFDRFRRELLRKIGK